MCKTIWEKASKWTAYGTDDIIHLILFCDFFSYSIYFWHQGWSKDWPFKSPQRGKKTKARKKQEKVWEDRTHIIYKQGPPCLCPSHQKKIRRMLAMSSTRQTLVEKPSLLLLFWISWYCGTYGRAPPNTMIQDASEDSNVQEPSKSSSCRTTSSSITLRDAQGCPEGLRGCTCETAKWLYQNNIGKVFTDGYSDVTRGR